MGGALASAWVLHHAPAAGKRWRWASIVLGSASALWLASYWGAERYLEANASLASVPLEQWRELVQPHVSEMSLAFAVGTAGVLVHGLVARTWARALAVVALTAAHVVTTVGVFGSYVPTVPNELVLPHSEPVDRLRQIVGNERVLFLGPNHMWVNTNALYGISTNSSYDALDVKNFWHINYRFARGEHYGGQSQRASVRALQLMGIRFVTIGGDWLPIDTLRYGKTPEQYFERFANWRVPRDGVPTVPVDADGVRDLLVPPEAGLSGLVVHLSTDGAAWSTPMEISLRERKSGRLVARREFRLADLPFLNVERRECVLRFEPQADSAQRRYVVELRSLDPERPAPPVKLHPKFEKVESGATAEDVDLEEDEPEAARVRSGRDGQQGSAPKVTAIANRKPLVVDCCFGEEFIHRGLVGYQHIYELRRSAGEAWVVGGMEPSPGDIWQELYRLGEPEFDTYARVMLDVKRDPVPDVPELKYDLEELEQGPQLRRWRVRSSAPGFLVTAWTHFPGWRGRVDGRDVPVHRANIAFLALEVPAGEHELELAYEPASVKLGFGLGALGLALIVGMLVRARRRIGIPSG